MQSAVVSGTQMSHYVDGNLVDQQSHTYDTVVQSMAVGVEIDGAPFVKMQVAAIIVYDRALSAAEHDQVHAYLQAKYFGN